MKLFFWVVTFSSALSFASPALLDCNTPVGSRNQQFLVHSEGRAILVKELKNNGSWTSSRMVSHISWSETGKLHHVSWYSPIEGKVNVVVDLNGDWVYTADGVTGMADCR